MQSPNFTDPVPIPPPAPGTCPARCVDCRLRATQAFMPISEVDLNFIEAFRTGVSQMPPGSMIIPEYKSSTRLYTLYSGWAFRFKTLSDGRRQILNFLLPGDLIGLQQEFVDQSTYGVETITAASLCEFPRDGLWELFREKPEMGYDITWLAAREEQMLDENLLSVGRRSATERIAMLLIHLYRRAERLGLAVDGMTEFPLTQQHIADALGLSLVHTNKTLRRLHKLGLHQIDDGRLRLLNVKALESLAEWVSKPMRRVPLV